MVNPEESGDNGNKQNDEQFRKMFVGGLSTVTSDESLKAFYSQWGELTDCIVMRDPTTKRSRGFGFVTFAEQSAVDAAMAARPHVIDDKTVDPKRAVPRDQSMRTETNISTKRLYVSGVREEHNENLFEEYFSQYGKVEKVDVILDKATGKPRGFAFVTFDDFDPVDKCVLIKSHQIAGHRCDVKKALSKEEMARAQQHDRERMERMDRSRGLARGGGDHGYSNYGGAGGYGGGYYGGGAYKAGFGGAYGQGNTWGAQAGGRQPYYGGSSYDSGSGGYGGAPGGGGYAWGGAGDSVTGAWPGTNQANWTPAAGAPAGASGWSQQAGAQEWNASAGQGGWTAPASGAQNGWGATRNA
ncbi:hypothetical protein AB6A40_006281 [Gnathostoma spinigerum]|uniref:RRM domain-containing protein n=1 Tax=Gnathostoma spinigerum TaxID=75299 RepID=A0ABD6EK56_9BILA